jgi:phosphoribosyl 1,2-cyclic phosphodiesterase
MIHVSILASGSSGNAILVRAGATTLLIDAGLTAKRLTDTLTSLNTSVATLDGILLTHEHGDHTRALNVLCSKNSVPIFTNPLTADVLRRKGLSTDWRIFSNGAAFQLGDFHILPFPVPHDAADPVGFVLTHATSSFAIATDLGYAARHVLQALQNVNALLLEANHDETLLQNDKKRPLSVKQRILSRHGHLSNAAAADLVAGIATPALRHVLLGHLSEDCNSPALATAAIRKKLDAAGHHHTTIDCPGAAGCPLPHCLSV